MNSEIQKEIELKLEEIKAIESFEPVTDPMFADVIKLRAQRIVNLKKSIRELKKKLI